MPRVYKADEIRRRLLSAIASLNERGIEPTPTILADETGASISTCRLYRQRLADEGLVEQTWVSHQGCGGGGGGDRGLGPADDAMVQIRVAIVRAAKMRLAASALDRKTLAEILPA